MDIKNHWLTAAERIDSPNIGGAMTPEVVVMHYTAGYDADGAIATFRNPDANVSAHLILEVDGSWTQMVPFNRVAWHAGPSRWNGQSGVNNFSIGIEIVNPGPMRRIEGGFRTALGGRRPPDRYINEVPGWLDLPDERAGSGVFAWPLYTERQLTALDRIMPVLAGHYSTLKATTGHRDIDTRGWKLDPGPAFPMRRYQMLWETRRGGETAATVNTETLNVRDAPSTAGAIVGVLRRGAKVTILGTSGDWRLVDGPDRADGWVNGRFLVED